MGRLCFGKCHRLLHDLSETFLIKIHKFPLGLCPIGAIIDLLKASISVRALRPSYTATLTLLLMSCLKQCVSSVSSVKTAPQNKLCLWSSLRCPDIFPLAYSTYGAACIKNSRCFPQCPRRPMTPHLNAFCSFKHASIYFFFFLLLFNPFQRIYLHSCNSPFN